MREFAKECLVQGQIFNKKQAVEWFSKHYPKIKSGTVQLHVETMSVNSPLRKHHPAIKAGSNYDFFYKIDSNRFRLWDPEKDPAPIYLNQMPESENGTESINSEDDAPEYETESSSREFAFERDLKNYLSKNLGSIEDGLRLYQDEDITGIEFPVGGRFIDILAVDKNDGFVVLELKVSRGYDRVIGQLLRYMAWIKQNMADGKNVRGIIVASEITEDLKLAASQIPNVSLSEYEISFKIKQINNNP